MLHVSKHKLNNLHLDFHLKLNSKYKTLNYIKYSKIKNIEILKVYCIEYPN